MNFKYIGPFKDTIYDDICTKVSKKIDSPLSMQLCKKVPYTIRTEIWEKVNLRIYNPLFADLKIQIILSWDQLF